VPDGSARYHVGQVVHHRRFGYRGVVVDVDPTFQLSDAWYEEMARSRPPRDRPWYHVLVDDADHLTYVAERHLESDPSGEPIRHPLLGRYFSGFVDGGYQRSGQVH
jgi:heat shock protein HspQ